LFCRVLICRRRKFSFPPERNASASLETKLEQPAFRQSGKNKDTGPMPITIRARPRMGPIPAAGCDAEHINQNAPPGRPAPSPEPLAGGMSFGGWTVDEWCSRWKICRGTYYALKRKGRGPPVVRIGNRDRITPAADAEWQAANDGAAA
ncbi:MAG TPA: hypothetical protein VN879_10380, partial [Candidatus Acidoferrales bacterium]|nr:hypothetical protein [Candidatus Acidoferrales bacterium]